MYFYEEYRSRKVKDYGNGIPFNNESRLDLPSVLDEMEALTETHKRFCKAPPAILEAECFKVQFPAAMLDIADNDCLAGRMDVLPLGIGHQYTNGEFGFVINKPWFHAALGDEKITDENKKRLTAVWQYWLTRNTIQKIEDCQPPEEKKYMHFQDWNSGAVSVLPSYRIAGLNIDYDKLLELGIAGLIHEVDRQKEYHHTECADFFDGIHSSLETVAAVFVWYAEQIREKACTGKNTAAHVEWIEMARICRKLSHRRPETFREALQLTYLYSLVAGTCEWGRMDDYLAEFYARDVRRGILDDEETIRLLSSCWRLMIAKEQITDDRVIIGGRGRKHEVNADRLALLMMESTRRVKEIVPQLILRFYEGQNPALYEKALDCIGEGCTYPMLYNDEVVIPGVMKVFGISGKEAEDWMPFGCGEFIINHRRINTPNSFLNLSNILLGTINNGAETGFDVTVTPDRGNLCSFETFEDLYKAYAANVDDLMEIGAAIQGRTYAGLRKDMAINLISVLYDDCLSRGKGLIEGGVAGLDGCCEMYGLVTASDSLYSIRKLVYEDKSITPETMISALKADFAGFEKEQAMMLDTAKYGNDIREADEMMARVHELVCFSSLSKSGKYGIDRYTIVNINNKGSTMLGRFTGATPNGRKKSDSLSNGNNPTSGMDKNGMTAFLKSLLKARTDIHAGVVQNMKFSKEVFCDLREKVAKPLLRTYFDNGGAQAMITVIGKEDLEAAMIDPAKYGNLIVRVGGFSAHFVELDHDIQTDILKRTIY